jgi:hypothetical protein
MRRGQPEEEGQHRHTLSGKEKTLPKENPDTLLSMNNLGRVLGKQGRYKAAEEMHRRALTEKEKVLGKEHTDTLVSVDNVGWVLERQGR